MQLAVPWKEILRLGYGFTLIVILIIPLFAITATHLPNVKAGSIPNSPEPSALPGNSAPHASSYVANPTPAPSSPAPTQTTLTTIAPSPSKNPTRTPSQQPSPTKTPTPRPPQIATATPTPVASVRPTQAPTPITPYVNLIFIPNPTDNSEPNDLPEAPMPTEGPSPEPTISPPQQTQTLNTATQTSSLDSEVDGLTSLGIFTDQACKTQLARITWGSIAPGTTTAQTLYVKNQGNTPMTLAKATTNWNPAVAQTYMTVNWDYTGQSIQPNGVLKVTLSLIVAANIQAISSFSFDTIITATG